MVIKKRLFLYGTTSFCLLFYRDIFLGVSVCINLLLLLSCLLLGPISLPWMSYVDPYGQGWEGNLTVFLYWCYERGVTGLHAILTGALLCLGCKKAKLEGKEEVS